MRGPGFISRLLPRAACLPFSAHLQYPSEKIFSAIVVRSASNSAESSSVGPKRQKLVILGTGWSSYSVLKNINKDLYDVIVVSPRNHFLFTPLLASTTVGTLEFRSIIEPVRNTGFRKTDHFHLSEAIGLDADKKELHCRSVIKSEMTYTINYDKLVIGVGAVSNTFGVPGVKEHAFFLKEISDARVIRNCILNNFEYALHPGISQDEREKLLHIVIVGGGPTGVEFGAELYDFVREDVSRLYKEEQDLVRVSLIEGRQILSSFSPKQQEYAAIKIHKRKQMELITANVTEVREDGVTLSNGKNLSSELVVWSTGLYPRRFVKKLAFSKNQQGQLLTNGHLKVLDDHTNSIYAIGDCGEIQDLSLPCTAQVAERQGRYLAECLAKKSGEDSPPFKFQNMGMLAYVGDYKGLTNTPVLKGQGFYSWLIWRSAYLTRLGSWRLRMQVPIDWTKTLLFGRDTSRF